MSAALGGVLLDTCALIWLVNGDLDESPAREAIIAAAEAGNVLVSTVSAWEVGLLSRPNARGATRVQFLPDPKTWFRTALSRPGIKLAQLTPGIAIDSSYLPGELHADPADRLIIATARQFGVPVITRDRRMIEYASCGFLEAVRC